MKFRNVISGPIFCADAPDVVIETADAAGIDVRLSISGFVWQFALSPVAEQSGYVATIKTRDILEALIEPSSIGSGGVSGVPVVEISAGADTESSISMSFQALYGSAAGKTPADMARHWLTWRDQISATYFGYRERLTFFAGLDLLGWKSGSYTVAVKIYTPSGIVQATLASGTIPSQVSYISVDASPASVLAVGEVSSLLAYDLSFSFSGTAADDTAATVESYPLRLVLGTADPRAKEFIYINSLGVEDRVTACGIRKDGLEGGSSKFVNGGVEREHGNEAQEQFEVYSGHLATARSVEQWMEFLKSSERHLYNAGLKGIVIDEYDTDAPEGELSSISFTYRLSERIRGFHHDDSESIGDYDPKQKYGALIVGDIPDATTPAAEDLFFLKTRLDEFPLVSLSEDYLLLVQSPVSYHWGAASLDSVKNWIQKTIDHNGISLAAVWASLSKTVPDTYANELISEDHIPTLPQSKVDGLTESLAALKALIGGKADSSQLADYVLKSTYDTGMSGKLDKSVFDKLFTVHYKEGSATEIESLELNYGTWTTGFLSVRGLDDTTGSGSGGTDLPAVWESLTKNELPYQDVTINTAHIPVLPQSKVTGLPDALSSLRASYTGISALIPQAATADNQLADKEFVNSSIATATATFRGTFATLAALEATPADRNDYAFWAHKDEAGNTCYDKYTYDGSAWKFEYRLNNSSFTAAQWGAINSGITGALVTRLSGISDWALAASKPSYTTAEVTEKTNLYFTDARAKSALTGHTGDTTIHITAAERTAWNAKWDWNEAAVKAVKVNAAGSADKLANSRKLWGNAFDGTADVDGDITLGSGKRIYFGSTSYYIELVNGNIHTNIGLYSDKFISARGVDPDAGGGSGASLPVVWASLQGNTDDYKDKTIHQAHIPTLPVSRIDGLATALAGKQALITADSKLDYSLLKNTPAIGNGTVTIKQAGALKGSFTMNQSGATTIELTDNNTTYSSLAAKSGGTDVSLVTTGEKYTWNNKQAAISDLATIRSNAATAYGWGDHSKAGYITGITKAMVESVLTGNITSHTHTFNSLTSKPTTLAGYGITDANRIFRYTIPASGNKGVRITFSANEPVKITVSGSNQHAQLVLVGTGYGEGGFSRNNFTELVHSDSGYSWCMPDEARSVEVFSTRTVADYVTVESPSPVTFTAISALSKTAVNRRLLNSLNYSSYALPLTGGTLNGWLLINASTLSIAELTADTSTLDTSWNRAQNINLLLRSENNAMTISLGGQSNERKGIIQVGHAATTYANVLGDLYLNKFGGKVYIGEKLAYHEGNANDLSTVWSAKRLVTPDNLICPYTWYNNNNITGTIVLSLPYSFNTMMQCIELTLYDYTTAPGLRGATKFIINGYNYYSATNSHWINPMVFRIGNANVNVRVGHYKNTCCILIGTTNNTWRYPRLCVDKLYGSFNNHADSFKNNDWSCTILQDESEITNIVNATDTPLYAPCYTRAGLPYVTDDDVAAKYLKLSGGTMAGDAAISWGVNDRTDWDTYVRGIRVMSSITANSGAPVQYATGISVMARYSFQIAAQGGDVDAFFIRAKNRDWKKLLHEGNYSSYALPLTGGTIKGSIRMDGTTTKVPIVRNFKYIDSTSQISWARHIAEIHVDDKKNFAIGGYGNKYIKDASDNKMTYAYLGFANYAGLNLRIFETDIKWGNNAIYHAGNSNLPTVPWNCSSLVANGSVEAKANLYGQSLEFLNISSSANHGGFIDFHFKGSTEDYTSRIIEDAKGQLTLYAATMRIGKSNSANLLLLRPSYNYIWADVAGGTLVLGTADGGGTSSSNSALFIKGKKVYIGGTESGNNALNVLGVAHATTGIYSDGYVSARGQDTSSDIRLKTDFRPLDGALEYIRGTHFTRFRWKDGSGESVGIIAQEEQSREYGFLVRSHGEIGHLTYDYAASTALLGAALQEEDEKVEALKRRVKELENELDRLKQSNYANR